MRIALAVVWFAFAGQQAVFAETATRRSGWNESYSQLLDHWLAARTTKLRIPGLGVAIVHGQEVLYCKGIGNADIAKSVPVTSKTRFRIGSQSKLFTAIAIMQLRDQSKLRLDTPMSEYGGSFSIPKGPDGSVTAISVRHLLTHTAGLSSVVHSQRPFWNVFPFASKEEIQRDLRELRPRLLFAPNAKLKYSNLGYVLLGDIVEKVSGTPYSNHITFNRWK